MEVHRQILKEYWGYQEFRPLQEEVIDSVAEGKDTLALMPTGGGKSITFQVPVMAMKGLGLIITPLIALMKDQTENLKKKNIKALAIHSGMSAHEIEIAVDNATFGDFKFLYLSPERLTNPDFRARLKYIQVCLIVIDEAHCISQWGYDFRPSYLKIPEIRPLFPGIPVLALTATATSVVVDDIQDKLAFRAKNVIRKSFERKNLSYIVRYTEDKRKYLLNIINNSTGSGIVYVRIRKSTREIAEFLRESGIEADYYHAGLTADIRNTRQTEWTNGITKVIVATNAFGMGIDKPDVRFVVHADLPDSLEEYFQEAGRAGRDEKTAYCVLLYNESDSIKANNRINRTFPGRDTIKRIYQALGNYFQLPVGSGKGMIYDFRIFDFASVFKFDVITVFHSIKFLEQEGYLELTDEINNPSRLIFLIKRDDLYKFQVENLYFDAIIKMVLRSYTGVFTDYVRIDEQLLSQRLNVSRELVYDSLKKLSNLRVIDYLPQKRTPLLIYTEERLDDKDLFISNERYEWKKNRYLDRMNATLRYATNNDICRSRVLLSYFGEENAANCGQCDVCKKKNELGLTQFEFEDIQTQIKELLQIKKYMCNELADKLSFLPEKSIKVINWLIDSGAICVDDDYLLKLM
ncbi:MAG: RecQ family ATP-dependent DNA helicase [Bacteroidia bacterium]|nr:RecQ family ATP-dependent DNA helicase [Bacteroidia bacterium]